jgi:HK97 family phage major capsid protein
MKEHSPTMDTRTRDALWARCTEFHERHRRGETLTPAEQHEWSETLTLFEIEALRTGGRNFSRPGLGSDGPGLVTDGSRSYNLAEFRSAVRSGDHSEQRQVEQLGHFVRALVLGDSSVIPDEFRSMNIGLGAGGGYTVPEALSAILTDYAGSTSRALQAGVRIVPMGAPRVTVPKIASVPTPAWYGEGEPIAEADITMSAGVLEARRLSTLVKASIEVLQDSALDIGQVVASEVGKSFARSIDKAVVAGSGSSGEPTGIRHWPDVPATSITPAPTWDDMIDAVSAVRQLNRNPNATVLFERDATTLGKLKDSEGRYIPAPAYLDGHSFLPTTNLALEGSASYAVTGEWAYCYLGVRLTTTQLKLDQRYADTGEVGFVFHWRGDVLVADANAFHLSTVTTAA